MRGDSQGADSTYGLGLGGSWGKVSVKGLGWVSSGEEALGRTLRASTGSSLDCEFWRPPAGGAHSPGLSPPSDVYVTGKTEGRRAKP